MKKETIRLQEFANQVKELADSVGIPRYNVRMELLIHNNTRQYYFSCWVARYGEYEGETPEIALQNLNNAINNTINPKQIKDVII